MAQAIMVILQADNERQLFQNAIAETADNQVRMYRPADLGDWPRDTWLRSLPCMRCTAGLPCLMPTDTSQYSPANMWTTLPQAPLVA